MDLDALAVGQCWKDVNDVLAAGVQRILLYGPPGTGKTYAALKLGLTVGVSERLVALRICAGSN